MSQDEPVNRFTTYSRSLRKSSTMQEKILWQKIRNNAIGFKFRRQYPVLPYIADFACVASRLIIEIDGSDHLGKVAYNSKREEYLKRLGWRVLRFTNRDIEQRLTTVLSCIYDACSTGFSNNRD